MSQVGVGFDFRKPDAVLFRDGNWIEWIPSDEVHKWRVAYSMASGIAFIRFSRYRKQLFWISGKQFLISVKVFWISIILLSFLANVNVLRYVCYMLWAVRLSSVCLSVCRLWRWCTLLRRLNFSAIFFHHTIAQGLYISGAKNRWWGTPLFPLKFAFKVTHPLSNSEISTNIT